MKKQSFISKLHMIKWVYLSKKSEIFDFCCFPVNGNKESDKVINTLPLWMFSQRNNPYCELISNCKANLHKKLAIQYKKD